MMPISPSDRRSRWRRLVWQWLPMLLWMAMIFAVSDQTRQELPSFGVWDYLVKKSGHFLSYAILALLAWRVTAETSRPFLWAMLITILYAISDELHQGFVPGRTPTLSDILIDTAGGITALLVLRLLLHWRPWKKFEKSALSADS